MNANYLFKLLSLNWRTNYQFDNMILYLQKAIKMKKDQTFLNV